MTKLQPKYIRCYGSSSTATTGTDGGLSILPEDRNRYHNQILISMGRVGKDICYNAGEGGKWLDDGTANDFLSTNAADISALQAAAPLGYLQVAVLLLGQNDYTTRSAAAIYADIQTIATAWRAAGVKVVVCTALCRSNSGEQTKANTVAQSIRDGFAGLTLDADAVADINASPYFDAYTDITLDPNNLFYDDTHCNTTGVALYAAIVGAAILTL